MLLTSTLFAIFYSRVDQIQRKNDPNRIENVKSALQLEDLDFVKMVDDLKLEFDEGDLREIEKQVSSRLSKVSPSQAQQRY